MKLKLYVFPEYDHNYSDGLAFAIAESEDAAKVSICNSTDWDCDEHLVELDLLEECGSRWGKCVVHELTELVAYGRTGGE